ncbi:hypothetical protein H9P43_002663 [Blastocladiella emersonii ATCC 22665]|nr:hypothetical protein H9P43_002663 [Blastocladiella emersonii ATCC 22665]
MDSSPPHHNRDSAPPARRRDRSPSAAAAGPGPSAKRRRKQQAPDGRAPQRSPTSVDTGIDLPETCFTVSTARLVRFAREYALCDAVLRDAPVAALLAASDDAWAGAWPAHVAADVKLTMLLQLAVNVFAGSPVKAHRERQLAVLRAELDRAIAAGEADGITVDGDVLRVAWTPDPADLAAAARPADRHLVAWAVAKVDDVRRKKRGGDKSTTPVVRADKFARSILFTALVASPADAEDWSPVRRLAALRTAFLELEADHLVQPDRDAGTVAILTPRADLARQPTADCCLDDDTAAVPWIPAGTMPVPPALLADAAFLASTLDALMTRARNRAHGPAVAGRKRGAHPAEPAGARHRHHHHHHHPARHPDSPSPNVSPKGLVVSLAECFRFLDAALKPAFPYVPTRSVVARAVLARFLACGSLVVSGESKESYRLVPETAPVPAAADANDVTVSALPPTLAIACAPDHPLVAPYMRATWDSLVKARARTLAGMLHSLVYFCSGTPPPNNGGGTTAATADAAIAASRAATKLPLDESARWVVAEFAVWRAWQIGMIGVEVGAASPTVAAAGDEETTVSAVGWWAVFGFDPRTLMLVAVA